MTAFEILVVILSVTLAILLIASIVLVTQITKLVKHLQRISERAEAVVEDVEQVGEFFKKGTGAIGIGKLVGVIVENFSNHKGKGKR